MKFIFQSFVFIHDAGNHPGNSYIRVCGETIEFTAINKAEETPLDLMKGFAKLVRDCFWEKRSLSLAGEKIS